MKIKINLVSVKYIECNNCGFKRSYPLPENDVSVKFYWICSRCNIQWVGGYSENGELFIELTLEEISRPDYIFIELDRNFIPQILFAQKREKPFDAGGDSATAAFRLTPVVEPRNFGNLTELLYFRTTLLQSSTDDLGRERSDFLPTKFFETGSTG